MKPTSPRRGALGAVVFALVAVLAVPVQARAQDGDDKKKAEDKQAFTLENIFPEKSMFGPRAGTPEWSEDGRFALWLYTPYDERRHGRDLWLLDTNQGTVTRLTSATVMGPFQKATREVIADRLKKHAKAKKKAEDKDSGKASKDKDDSELGDQVVDGDAEDEKAPRYGGVSSHVWAPEGAEEFLFTSAGDIYRYTVADGSIARLTRTDVAERSVEYLPDGSGYVCMADSTLRVVRFGDHLIEQVEPDLPSGERMSSYKLSPDGTKITFLARKGPGVRSGGRRVKIARYTDRFMEVREVSRHVSDDPLPETFEMVYLLDLTTALEEQGRPVLLHTHKVSGPRDVLQVPRWAPDSSRVTFAVFEQKSNQVMILEGRFPEAVEDEEESEKNGKDKDSDKDEEKEKDKDKEKDKEKLEPVIDQPAKVVYRFLHYGGPNAPREVDPRYLGDSRRVVYVSEQTGFQHLHLLDPLYESQRPLTTGAFEVEPVELDEDSNTMVVLATKEDSTCVDVYHVDLETGEMTRLSVESGEYSSPAVSPDGRYLLGSYSCFGQLRELVQVDLKHGRQKTLTDSHPEHAVALTSVAPEFFAFENRHGHRIRGHMFKPEGLRSKDTRPLLVYVYGGPLGSGRKQVAQGNLHAASYFFAQYMAREHGWITCTVDPRGMSGYGGMFEKANFEQVGKPQVEDLVDAVRFMVDEHQADPDKVALHGWSFGGFQTQMCLYTEPDVFHVGIAGAGPTEWENYNSWYTQGTIGETRVGKPDLQKFSLLPLAKNLKGRLLLVHGMEDSNVLYQDTVRVYRELLKAGKETLVDLFLDPTGGHGLGGDIETLGRYRKYEAFLVNCLGSHD